jgi:exodeoxyribonuclease (lambda-induced)
MNAPISQDDPLWLRARVGSLTASRMREARAKLKRGGESAERKNYKLELVAERLSSTAVEHYVSKAMQDGIEREPLAADAYEVATGTFIEPGGYLTHRSIEYFGASPDRLIADDGLVEIKCPTLLTYTEWLLEPGIPEEHVDQMLAQLAVTGRKWCDFVAFHPAMPTDKRLIVRRLVPSKQQLADLEVDAQQFLFEVDELYKKAAA